MGRFSRDRLVGLLVRVEVEAVCVVEVEEELMADAEAEVEAAWVDDPGRDDHEEEEEEEWPPGLRDRLCLHPG